MQNAKDSFYEMLRGRLSSLNPERTVVVRGVTRPALIVDENETPSTEPLPDCFHLRWTGAETACEGPLPLLALECEIAYSTAGNGWNGGLDRGRVLASMDGELVTALSAQPQYAAKLRYDAVVNGGSAVQMRTNIWWSELNLKPAKADADRVARSATLKVMTYQEAGEL